MVLSRYLHRSNVFLHSRHPFFYFLSPLSLHFSLVVFYYPETDYSFYHVDGVSVVWCTLRCWVGEWVVCRPCNGTTSFHQGCGFVYLQQRLPQTSCHRRRRHTPRSAAQEGNRAGTTLPQTFLLPLVGCGLHPSSNWLRGIRGHTGV